MPNNNSRRMFIAGTAAAIGAVALPRLSALRAVEVANHKEAEISAPEDLMREHGLLNRILLVYEEGIRRLREKEDVPPEIFLHPARLVRQFVEDYHEKLEERFIFPRFEEKRHSLELVKVLKEQHKAGRKLTDTLLRDATPPRFQKAEVRDTMTRTIEAFIKMYRPHEAREDTVLFPALYTIATEKEIQELGEQFEEEEHRLFGKDGFKANVDKVAEIEKQLGIYNLASFTPK